MKIRQHVHHGTRTSPTRKPPQPLLAGLLAITAACGNDAAPAASGTATTTPPPAEVTTVAEQTTPTSAVTTAASTATAMTTTEQGTMTAERIVVSDQAVLDAALAIDLPVVGIPGFADRQAIPDYLAKAAGDVEVLAERSQVNLESLAAVEPDTLLFTDKVVEASGAADQLAEIAELVELEVSTTRPWRAVLRDVADSVGVPQRAEARIAEVDAKFAKAREQIGPDGLATEVSVVRCYRASCRYLPGGTSFSGQVLDDLGVARPEPQASDPDGRAFVEVSPEQVELLDGDIIVIFGTDAEESLAALQENPLWRRLDAVKADRVYEVDAAAWFSGNALAVEAIIDDVVELLS